MQPQENKGDVKNHDPNGPPKNAGSFVSPQTKQRVFVFRKTGESNEAAWTRVRKHHGL